MAPAQSLGVGEIAPGTRDPSGLDQGPNWK